MEVFYQVGFKQAGSWAFHSVFWRS